MLVLLGVLVLLAFVNRAVAGPVLLLGVFLIAGFLQAGPTPPSYPVHARLP